MHEPNEGMRVLEVEGLGYEAAIVRIAGETLLLMDVVLDCDERIDVMNRAMAQVS